MDKHERRDRMLSEQVADLETRLLKAEQLAEEMREDASFHRKCTEAWTAAGDRLWKLLTGEAASPSASQLEAKVKERLNSE